MTRLVLTRKLEESVVVHDKNGVITTLKVSRIDKNQIRLTFEAEKNVNIDREEIYNLKQNK
jgi:carbon storage regulator CsrA|tara:strand:+ start:9 stop:191 length:183 start_codon:yes stop_codon:yes gene_type:complete